MTFGVLQSWEQLNSAGFPSFPSSIKMMCSLCSHIIPQNKEASTVPGITVPLAFLMQKRPNELALQGVESSTVDAVLLGAKLI